MDEMIGEINVDSLRFTAPDKKYFMKNMNIRATRQNNENQLRLTSEFLTASVEGKFQYHTLPTSILNIMRKYTPSLILPPKSRLKHIIIFCLIFIYIIQISYLLFLIFH